MSTSDRALTAVELVHALRLVHGLSEGQHAALGARLKHLLRLGLVPRRGHAGRSAGNTYGWEEILKVAVVFQLIEIGMSSSHAVDVVGASWPMILEAAKGSRDGRLVLLRPRATLTLAGAAVRNRPVWGTAELVDRGDALGAEAVSGGTALVLLDPISLAGRLADVAKIVVSSRSIGAVSNGSVRIARGEDPSRPRGRRRP